MKQTSLFPACGQFHQHLKGANWLMCVFVPSQSTVKDTDVCDVASNTDGFFSNTTELLWPCQNQAPDFIY